MINTHTDRFFWWLIRFTIIHWSSRATFSLSFSISVISMMRPHLYWSLVGVTVASSRYDYPYKYLLFSLTTEFISLWGAIMHQFLSQTDSQKIRSDTENCDKIHRCGTRKKCKNSFNAAWLSPAVIEQIRLWRLRVKVAGSDLTNNRSTSSLGSGPLPEKMMYAVISWTKEANDGRYPTSESIQVTLFKDRAVNLPH